MKNCDIVKIYIKSADYDNNAKACSEITRYHRRLKIILLQRFTVIHRKLDKDNINIFNNIFIFPQASGN